MAERKSGLAFHCHHDNLYEYVSDYEERVRSIKNTKPHGEQELRLKLFQLIPSELLPGRNSPEWEAYNKTREAYNKAREAYSKANEAYGKANEADYKANEAYLKANEAYNKAREAYNKMFNKEIGELHKEVCPNCPFDGTTIFTRKDEDGNWK